MGNENEGTGLTETCKGKEEVMVMSICSKLSPVLSGLFRERTGQELKSTIWWPLKRIRTAAKPEATGRKSNKVGDKASIKEWDRGNRSQMKRSCLESQSKYMNK